MSFRIPAYFQLHGFTIKTEYAKALQAEEGNNGEARFYKDKILIQDSKTGEITKERQGQVFCHELTHWILLQMGEKKLNDNEKFVDLFGNLLFQALDSAKYSGAK